jgi:sortase A
MEIAVFDTDGRSYRYLVTNTQVVDSTTTRIRLDAAVPTLLLTTCYPFDALTAGGPLRYLVSAEAAL